MVGMHILNITHIAIEGRTLEEEGRVEHHLKTYTVKLKELIWPKKWGRNG